MPHNGVKEKLVKEWLHKAEEDFKTAGFLLKCDDCLTNVIAYHAQQAAEKFLKAFLTANQIMFPKTHDLQRLLELTGTINPQMMQELNDIIILTPYGVEIRYPGDRPDASQEEVNKAVEMILRVRNCVLDALRNIV
ncbi:MAG TPA: HEPN domain-containing protein [Candidatus Hydrogenedentes bacterium]|nr:HEPN domain-containing protein [Candidatus Hydrogenedentota bacterium]